MITITTCAILFRDIKGNWHRNTGPAYFVNDLYFISKYYYQRGNLVSEQDFPLDESNDTV